MTDVIDPVEALRDLIRSYEALIYTARDRIIDLGGDCDPAPRMIADDPALREARAALTAASEAGWVLVKRDAVEQAIEHVRWIDREYENVNMDHRHFRIGAKVKALDTLDLLAAMIAASQPEGEKG